MKLDTIVRKSSKLVNFAITREYEMRYAIKNLPPGFFNNLKKADQLNKYFIYVVCFDKKIAIFNITNLVKQKYNFKWEKRKLPKSTMLNEKKKLIYKNVGYINLKDTSITINIT